MTPMPDDRLLPELILTKLQSGPAGWDIRYYETLDSTNNEAKTLAKQGCAHGVVVIAEEQTSGRGRLNRGWAAAPRAGVYMSVVLRLGLPPKVMPCVTLLTSLAVVDAIKAVTGIEAGIKWPNDVYIGARKCCGILVEQGSQANGYAVVGIGVNVRPASVPEALSARATALDMETGGQADRAGLCAALLSALGNRVGLWQKNGDFSAQMREYCLRSITLGKRVNIIEGAQIITGIVERFDEVGMIMLRKKDGSLQRIASGDVSLREA